ncbi:MAG: DUF4302 domain-containing protein [Prevotella sp.]|nr:DUF4302 domain-containing protein [Prevotella sp.]
MKKLFIYLTFAAAALSMQSCLHDNEDTFDMSAAERIDMAVAEAKALLVSADNGWKLEYYLGSKYSYGGYNYLVKFGSDGKARVAAEIAASDAVSQSAWDITKDQGPVLTFNTYNEFLHELTQPYQDAVDGYEGDYEFIIMKTTPDTIYLEGKKWHNAMIMTRNASDLVWKDYLDKIAEVKDNFIYLYKANIGGSEVKFNMNADKQVSITDAADAELATAQFIFTTAGIKFREPVTVNGVTFDRMNYNANTTDIRQSTLVTENGTATLEGNVPATFQLFDEIGGSYRLTANGRSATVTLEGEKTWSGKAFKMKGLIKNEKDEDVDMVIQYDPVYGQMQILPQYLGTHEEMNVPVYALAWAIDPAVGSGSISTNSKNGIKLIWNQNQAAPAYTFEPMSAGFLTNSFILYWRTEDDGDVPEDWKTTLSGDYRLAYLTSLTKL